MGTPNIAGLSGQPFPQNQFEIEKLAQFMVSRGCRSYLEIGARFGDSFHFLACHLPNGSRAVAVDLPGAAFGKANSEPFLARARSALKENGLDARVIIGQSRAADVIEAARARGPYDAVFIDGDHSLEGVTADWLNYGPMARKLVAFHDIVSDKRAGKRGKKFGVGELWRSLEGDKMEIVGRDSPMGIGIIFL